MVNEYLRFLHPTHGEKEIFHSYNDAPRSNAETSELEASPLTLDMERTKSEGRTQQSELAMSLDENIEEVKNLRSMVRAHKLHTIRYEVEMRKKKPSCAFRRRWAETSRSTGQLCRMRER